MTDYLGGGGVGQMYGAGCPTLWQIFFSDTISWSDLGDDISC